MATTVISGRVDTLVVRQVQILLQREGVSPGEVIKSVWEEMAETGEVPRRREERERTARQQESLARLERVRNRLASCDALHTLTDEQMEDMIVSRYA